MIHKSSGIWLRRHKKELCVGLKVDIWEQGKQVFGAQLKHPDDTLLVSWQNFVKVCYISLFTCCPLSCVCIEL